MNSFITAVEEWIDNRIARIADQKIKAAVADVMSSREAEVDWDEVDRRIESEFEHKMMLFTLTGHEEEIEEVVKEFIRDNVTVEINV